MAVDETRVRDLIESSRGFRLCMGPLSVEDNGKLFSDVRRLVKNYTKLARQVVDKLYDDPEMNLRLRSQTELEWPAGCSERPVQQGRSKRRGESYSPPYVEPLSVARTPLADFVNSLLGRIRIDCRFTTRIA